MNILAWIIFVLATIEVLIAPASVGKETKRTPLYMVISSIIWATVASFAGIFLFGGGK